MCVWPRQHALCVRARVCVHLCVMAMGTGCVSFNLLPKKASAFGAPRHSFETSMEPFLALPV